MNESKGTYIFLNNFIRWLKICPNEKYKLKVQ